LKRKSCSILQSGLKGELEISILQHPDVCCSLSMIDYDTEIVYLGSDVHPDDVEELTEDILTHEYMHYVLFKNFGIVTAKKYDKIYGHVEPKGRVITIGFQGME